MSYFIEILTQIAIFAIAAISLNIVFGLTGIVTLTHAAFMAIGAFTTGILCTLFGLNFFISIIPAFIITMLISAVVGIPSLRVKGDAYLSATLALQIALIDAIYNLEEITGGWMGLSGIPRPTIFGLDLSSSIDFLIMTIVFLLAACWYAKRVSKSPLGRALRAIREDDVTAQSLGKRTTWLRIWSYVVTAGIVAVAGCLFASYSHFIHPSSFVLHQSVMIFAMVILGGQGTILGSIVGAIIVVGLPGLIRIFPFIKVGGAPQIQDIAFGTLLLLFVFYRPKGLFREYGDWRGS